MGIALREAKESRAALIKIRLGNLDHFQSTTDCELESEASQRAAIFATIYPEHAQFDLTKNAVARVAKAAVNVERDELKLKLETETRHFQLNCQLVNCQPPTTIRSNRVTGS